MSVRFALAFAILVLALPIFAAAPEAAAPAPAAESADPADAPEAAPKAPEAPKGAPGADLADALEAEVLGFWAPIRPLLPKILQRQKAENRNEYEEHLRGLKNEMGEMLKQKAEHPEDFERGIRQRTIDGRIEHLRDVCREALGEEQEKAKADLKKVLAERFDEHLARLKKESLEAQQEAQRHMNRSLALQKKIEILTKYREDLIESRLARELYDVDYFDW